MAEKVGNLTELPLDILVLIFPYLDAKSFLALCSTCRAFQQPSIRQDPAYWSFATRSTFRVPNQPVVQHDGARWQKLYRRLLTQSRVYTWGNNTDRRLGHNYTSESHRANPRAYFPAVYHTPYCHFPTEMEHTKELGVIADLQCGGWSTTILTSRGALYTAGVLDGQRLQYNARGRDLLRILLFPVGYPYSTAAVAYNEPAIAIRQFSAGRSHLLALSDNGRIWSWYEADKPALQIKFVDVDLKDLSVSESRTLGLSLYGRVKQVVAGWSCSSAYIYGEGILLWEQVRRETDDEETDTMLVLENYKIPKTGYQRLKSTAQESADDKALGEEVGAVLNYIILERFVVFVTDTGKVFCAKLGTKNKVDDVLELASLRNDRGTSLDVQGSFRRFAIFKNGEVLITDQNYLEECWNTRNTNTGQTSLQGIKKIPSLQHNDVISVAFGDYHFLALHSTGKITSYGAEVQSCGALGLGPSRGSGRLRGVAHRGGSNGELVPHAYAQGRQVWFRPQQHEWLNFLIHGGKNPEEAKERLQLFASDSNVQGEVSEWIEQEGREWDKNKGDDGLGAFFALRVSAAGWHSGAVVLANDELAHGEPPYPWQEHSFPRLKLSDNREMPGTVPFDEWREGMPEWHLEEMPEIEG